MLKNIAHESHALSLTTIMGFLAHIGIKDTTLYRLIDHLDVNYNIMYIGIVVMLNALPHLLRYHFLVAREQY